MRWPHRPYLRRTILVVLLPVLAPLQVLFGAWCGGWNALLDLPSDVIDVWKYGR